VFTGFPDAQSPFLGTRPPPKSMVGISPLGLPLGDSPSESIFLQARLNAMRVATAVERQYTAAGVLFTVTVPLYTYVQKLLLIATLVESRILCQLNNPILTGMHTWASQGWALVHKTTYAPMIYTALCVMLLMRAAYITRASGRGLGPGNQEFFRPLKWYGADGRVPFGAQKTQQRHIKCIRFRYINVVIPLEKKVTKFGFSIAVLVTSYVATKRSNTQRNSHLRS
jgi:hypothetical protein